MTNRRKEEKNNQKTNWSEYNFKKTAPLRKKKKQTENKETSGINEPRDLEPQHRARKVKIGDWTVMKVTRLKVIQNLASEHILSWTHLQSSSSFPRKSYNYEDLLI